MILPFLRSITVRMKKQDVLYLLGVRLVIDALIPMSFLIVNGIADSEMQVFNHILYFFNVCRRIVDIPF